MVGPSLLDRIFTLQEEVLRRNATRNADRVGFISRALEAIDEIGVSDTDWATIPIEMRTLYNYFEGDSVSTLISATRLCLHGCETDAFALMRIVLENLTILDYIATKRLHREAFAELQGRSRRGRPFSDHFSYEAAARETDATDRRRRLRGHLSVLGSHASPSRLALSRTQRGGVDHLKIGVALDNPRVRQALGELAALALFAARVVGGCFQAYLPALPARYAESASALEEAYVSLQADE